MKSTPRKIQSEDDEQYLERCLERYVDEVRRRVVIGESSTVRIGVKVENGRVVSIKSFAEDDYERLGE